MGGLGAGCHLDSLSWGAVDGPVLVHNLLLFNLPTARPVSMVRGGRQAHCFCHFPEEMSWVWRWVEEGKGLGGLAASVFLFLAVHSALHPHPPPPLGTVLPVSPSWSCAFEAGPLGAWVSCSTGLGGEARVHRMVCHTLCLAFEALLAQGLSCHLASPQGLSSSV